MKGKKNDFSVSFFDSEGKRTLFLEYVHDTENAVKWAESKKINWEHYNIYERRTRLFLEQKKRGIP